MDGSLLVGPYYIQFFILSNNDLLGPLRRYFRIRVEGIGEGRLVQVIRRENLPV